MLPISWEEEQSEVCKGHEKDFQVSVTNQIGRK